MAHSRSESRFRYTGTSESPEGSATASAFGAAHDRAGEVEGGGHPVLARDGEVGRHVEALEQVVDPGLERAHHVRRHQARPRLELPAVLRGGGHFRHQDVEIAGERGQPLVQLGAGGRPRRGPGRARPAPRRRRRSARSAASPCGPARRRAARSSRRRPSSYRSSAAPGRMLAAPFRELRRPPVSWLPHGSLPGTARTSRPVRVHLPAGAARARGHLRRRHGHEPPAARAGAPTTSAAPSSRAATRSSSRRSPSSWRRCTARSTRWDATSSRPTPSARPRSCWPSTAWPTGPAS